MLNGILWPDHIQWQPPTDQTLYRTRPFTEFWVVSLEHLQRVWHADRGRLLLRTPGPVPLGLAYVLLVETNPFPNLSLFYRTMLFEYVLSIWFLEFTVGVRAFIVGLSQISSLFSWLRISARWPSRIDHWEWVLFLFIYTVLRQHIDGSKHDDNACSLFPLFHDHYIRM